MTFTSFLKKFGYFPVFLLLLHLLNPFSKAHIFGYFLIFYFLLLRRNEIIRSIDRDAVILLIFSVVYSLIDIFGENKGVQYLFIQSLFPFFFYLIGKHLMFKSLSKTSIISIFLAMGIIYGLTSFSSVGVELLKNGFAAGLLDRDVPIIWTGEKLKATGMSASMIYFLILPGVIMTNKERLSLFWKLILLALFAIAVLCTFRLGSRTGIAIIIITILFTIILQLRTKNNAQKIKFLLQIAIIIFLVLKFVPFDLDADYLSVLGDRLQNPHGNSTESAGGRTDLWENAIGNLFAHPLGWKSSIYNHNLWLDIAMTNGILPLVLLMIFNVFNFINLRKVLFHKQSDLGINSLFLLFNLATFLQFFVEPIYQGSFFLFSFYCLFQGCIKRYLELSHYGNVYQKPKKKVRI